jgi:hypothetical protein
VGSGDDLVVRAKYDPAGWRPQGTVVAVAGAISGEVGLLVFLTTHHVWIVPIWYILPAGALFAGFGGLAVGWSYAEMRSRLPSRPWKQVARFELMVTTLALPMVLAPIRLPMVDVAVARLVASTTDLILRFRFALLVPPMLVGALEGWALLHSCAPRRHWHLPGYSSPVGPAITSRSLAVPPAVGKEISMLIAAALDSSITLAKADEWLERYPTSGDTGNRG